MNFSEKIKQNRKQKGFSQSEVALKAGISQAAFGKIESGFTKSITIEVGIKISKALEISFNELFEIEDTGIEVKELKNQTKILLDRNAEYEKRLSDQDYVIQVLKNELKEIKRDLAFIRIDQLLEYIVKDQLEEKNGNPGDKPLLFNSPLESEELSELIKESIEKELITTDQLIDLFIDMDLIFDLIGTDGLTKLEFSKKFAIYMNRFFKVDEQKVAIYFNRHLFEPWDSEEMNKKARKIFRKLNIKY